MSAKPSAREFLVATAGALFLGVALSFGAVYGLNWYFDEHEEIGMALTILIRLAFAFLVFHFFLVTFALLSRRRCFLGFGQDVR